MEVFFVWVKMEQLYGTKKVNDNAQHLNAIIIY